MATRLRITQAKITLEKSRSGMPDIPQIFENQTFDVLKTPNTHITGVDGNVSTGSHPSEILWLGADLHLLDDVTHIKIFDKHGALIVSGELNTFYGRPSAKDGGSFFYIL